MNVRVLLDSCSQRSYISQRLRDVLKLPTVRTDQLMIKTFGSESEQLTDCDLTTICMTSVEPGGISMYLNAYTVPFICSPVSNQCIDLAQKNYPHLMDLKLADSSEGTLDLEVHCMIGADYYWTLVTDEVKRGLIPGPVTIRTTLGWVLSGPVNAGSSPDTSVHLTSTHVVCTQQNLNRNLIARLERSCPNFGNLKIVGLNLKMALFMIDLKKQLFLMVHIIKCPYLLKRDMHYFLIILL